MKNEVSLYQMDGDTNLDWLLLLRPSPGQTLSSEWLQKQAMPATGRGFMLSDVKHTMLRGP